MPDPPAASSSRINPFKYDRRQHSGVLQLFKMVLIGLVLFVPRLLILLFALMLMALTSSLRMCCNASPHETLDDDTRLLMPMKGGAFSMFLLRVGARLVMFSFGYWWISVEDRRSEEDRKRRAPVIAANHVSFVDAFYFAYADGPMGVGKAELFKIPIIGSIAKATQMIGVSRQDATRSHGAADEIKRRVRWQADHDAAYIAEHGDWPPLLIFPEATCTNTNAVIQFKLGAFAPRMPVQPVALDFRQSHLDVSWVDSVSPALTALRMMCQLYNRATITYLPIVDPPPSARDDEAQATADGHHDPTIPAFAQAVRSTLAAGLGVPTTEHNFLDIVLAWEATKLRLPRGEINVEMGAYSEQGDKGAVDRVKAALREFARIDANRDGWLDEAEFASLLGFTSEASRLAHGSLIRAAFQHWDRDDDGRINFREFLLLSSAMKVSKLTQEYQMRVETAAAAAAVGSPSEGGGGDAAAAAALEPNAAPGVAVGGVRSGRESVEEMLTRAPSEVPIGDELRDAFALAFSAFDLDNDGVVTGKEVADILRKTAPGIDVDQARALFLAAASVSPSASTEPLEVGPGAAGGSGNSGQVTVSFPQYMRLCEQYPVLVGSFLDAIAALDVGGQAAAAAGTGRREGSSSPTSTVGAHSVDGLAPKDIPFGTLSRENTFVVVDDDGDDGGGDVVAEVPGITGQAADAASD